MLDVRRSDDEPDVRRRFDTHRQGVDPLFAQHQNDELPAPFTGCRVVQVSAPVATVFTRSGDVWKIGFAEIIRVLSFNRNRFHSIIRKAPKLC